jgi:phage terminase large subunit
VDETVKFSELVHFTPKQIEATRIADAHRYTLFGGSAGPGKSYWLRWYLVLRLLKWGKELGLTGIRGALFSEDFPTLKDRQISKMEVEFPSWLGEIKDSKTHGLGFHLSESYGGHVVALRNLDDPSKYLSSEFAIIGVEELTRNNVEEIFPRLRSRNRWTGIDRTQIVAATNPGGIGHNYTKKIFIDRDFPPEEREPEEFAYVPALPTDNPHLAGTYITTLQSLPERMRKAYLEGNWDVFEGQFFGEWDKTKHVVEPFKIPDSWKKLRSIDVSGRSGITSCHWYAIDHDGAVWAYREYYATGRDSDEHAREITRLSEGEYYPYTVIDSAAFAMIGLPETTAEVYIRNGVNGLVPSDKKRLSGWDIMHQYLRWDETHEPRLKFFKTCVNAIRTIPLLIHDDKHPEDVDTRGEDHAGDECRYVLQTLRDNKSPRPMSVIERHLMAQKGGAGFDFNY